MDFTVWMPVMDSTRKDCAMAPLWNFSSSLALMCGVATKDTRAMTATKPRTSSVSAAL